GTLCLTETGSFRRPDGPGGRSVTQEHHQSVSIVSAGRCPGCRSTTYCIAPAGEGEHAEAFTPDARGFSLPRLGGARRLPGPPGRTRGEAEPGASGRFCSVQR